MTNGKKSERAKRAIAQGRRFTHEGSRVNIYPATVARSTDSHLVLHDPGTHAPGFLLSPASQVSPEVGDNPAALSPAHAGWASIRRLSWGSRPRLYAIARYRGLVEVLDQPISNVSLVVFNTINFQEMDELIPKRRLRVMLLLSRNIVPYFFDI
jgi:hypothetical protein